ncbi:hypothetical protein FYK55_16985 [Roseiconus nitratireducens]|uniref:Uncharacterized protein n=1 Tax=Roseiconus nitratireducens TaxID=2605748 RepID=A0A5M6D334_9BACT|nr:hypothetical protein [Roseiconus nitratireducens]KAA5541891.1 hypothetical protein FYK55_16985 [Roseiconus nitratireducens]
MLLCTDVADMSPDERCHEIVSIFAGVFLRIGRDAVASQTGENSSESSLKPAPQPLDPSAETVLSVHTG